MPELPWGDKRRLMRFLRVAIFTVGLVLLIAVYAWADIGYTVRENESLEQVAAKFNIPLEKLLKANNIEDPPSVEPGTRLVIPIVTQDNDNRELIEKPSWGYIEHTIKSGDSLFKIAKKYNTTIERLADFNKISKDKTLQIGDIIKVPIREKEKPKETKKPITIFDLGESDGDDSESKMIVNVKANNIDGKNLLDISELDDAVVEIKSKKSTDYADYTDIKQASKSEDKSGKTENKKQSKPKYITHVIAKGDTISRISKTYGVSQKSIMDENGITSRTTLRIGQKLKIPNPALNDKPNPEIEDGLVSRNLTKRDKLVRYALQYVGTRYSYSGANLEYGVDCSGFTMKVFEHFGISLPHSSADQSKVGRSVEKNNLVPGDLLFFRTTSKSISHVGIYIGDGKFVHSTRTGHGVVVNSLSDEYYLKRYVCARRVL